MQDDGEDGDANGSGDVGLDGSAWLRPNHFDEGLTEGDHFFGCGVGAPSLALAAEDMTNFILWEIDRTGPLCLGKFCYPRQRCRHQLCHGPLIHCENMGRRERRVSCR